MAWSWKAAGKSSLPPAEGVASAVDDVRHKLIEEGWFSRPAGREVTGDIETEPEQKPDVSNVAHSHVHSHAHVHANVRDHPMYREMWGNNTSSRDVYGDTGAKNAPEIDQSRLPDRSREPGLEPEL